jgi:hypothetical protein
MKVILKSYFAKEENPNILEVIFSKEENINQIFFNKIEKWN